MIQESTILMTFHSQLTRSFLHLPFCEVPQPCLPGTQEARKPTAQFGGADLCCPWGLKRWDLTIQTGSDQIRRVEGWRHVFMRSSHSTNFRGKVPFFPWMFQAIGTWSWDSLLSEQYDCGRTVVVEIWAKHCSPSNLVDLRVSQHLARKRSWSRVWEDLFHNSTRRLIMMLQVHPCQTTIPEETQNQM